MTAGLTAMELFDEAAVTRLNALAARARAGINRAIRDTGAAACVTGHGSMLRVHMKRESPNDYREAYATPDESKRLKALLAHLFDRGVILINSGTATLSTPMTEAEIDTLVDAFRSGFETLAAMR